ncbi:MAG: phage tail protein [Coprobacillus cateniformis]|nr:phage tail protein [Coprobacillus cateniformis]
MLANGATLEYKTAKETTYTKLAGLKEIPEMGVEPEKVENTTLEDTIKSYEMGIGDPGDIAYKFKYDNTDEKSPYRVLRAYEKSGEVLSFKETLKDGTTTSFSGQISLKRTGGGVNGVIEFDLNIALSSALEIEDPEIV